MRLPAIALALSLAIVAGCFDKDAADGRRVSGTEADFTPGFAYDGGGLVATQATINGDVYNGNNTGLVDVTFNLDGVQWNARFDQFAQAEGKDFQDGGIAFDLDEHGDTGVADTTIPRIHARIAAWGSALVTRDGVEIGGARWPAHLMVSDDTVRGADGKITKADGTTPYDPNAPGDARRVEGDPQAIFWIKHPDGETAARAPANVSGELLCRAPECDETADLPIEEGALHLSLNFTILPADPTLPVAAVVGNGRLVVEDANGTEIVGVDIATTPSGPPPPVPAEIPLEGVALPLKLHLTGSGTFGGRVDGVATYGDRPFIVLTWDEIVVGDL